MHNSSVWSSCISWNYCYITSNIEGWG
jgi:hypothetical protein